MAVLQPFFTSVNLGFLWLPAVQPAGGPTTTQLSSPLAPDGPYPPGAARAVVGPD